MSIVNSIRNPDGIWINSQAFREEALNFKKYGYYCADPEGSPDWFNYWQEQRRRCRFGYAVGGSRITGDHYFYLNFCPIMKTEEDEKGTNEVKRKRVLKGSKELDFPDFWDGDYNYYWSREIARNGVLDSGIITIDEADEIYNLPDLEQAIELKKVFDSLHLEVRIEVDYLYGGYNLIVGKSRRKGYSFKNASIGVNNYLTRPNKLTIFGAEDKKYLYPKGIFTMANNYLNFITQHTPWIYPRDVINQASKGHFRASTLETKNGVPVEVGFMSELMSLTFSDNPDAARGKDAFDLIFEEAGSFGPPGLLKDSYKASEDCVMDGDVKTGLITIFGTSGDMGGGTADYAEMHGSPLRFGLLPFQNVWDEDSEDTKCGFFHPITWNMPGHYDRQGNSNLKSAKDAELKVRKTRKDNGATSSDMQSRMQEKPFGPFEAFGMVSTNNFPVLELKRQLDITLSKGLHLTKGTPVKMYYDYETKRVKADPILDGTANVIYRRMPENTSLAGCPVIYEYPVDRPAPGAYKIGYDPYRQDRGSSLAAIIVYKSVIIGHRTKRIIVAEYTGRPNEADDVNYIARLFAELYNTKVMHENDVTHVKSYFRKRKQLHFLAVQPDAVISKNVKNSKVARVYGCHMIDKLKDAGEKYIKDWLLEVIDFDENDDPIRTIDRIYSPGLLEELIAYNRKGNFDRVMALMQVMFQEEEEALTHVYEEKAKPVGDKGKKLIAMMSTMYAKNNSKNLNRSIN
jgi:hypothetical protein